MKFRRLLYESNGENGEKSSSENKEKTEEVVTKIPERENNSELGNLFNEQQTTKNTRNDYAKVIEETHREVASMLAKLDNVTEKDVESLINEYLTENYPEIGRNDRTYISKSIQNEITGLGPLEELINDSTVSEIMVNGPNQIYVERKGKLVLSDVKFQDEEHVRRIIDRIVTPLGRRIDDSNPMVDARLKDGSRVNAIIPPLALCGSTITIRKFSDTPLTIESDEVRIVITGNGRLSGGRCQRKIKYISIGRYRFRKNNIA